MATEFRCKNLMEKRPLGRPRYRWEDNIKIETLINTMGT
jgi:hypothetical protein